MFLSMRVLLMDEVGVGLVGVMLFIEVELGSCCDYLLCNCDCFWCC